MGCILGLNVCHGNFSARPVQVGVLIAAAEEEWFLRAKQRAGFSGETVRYCLRKAGISIGAVDHVAIDPDSGANYLRKITYTLMNKLADNSISMWNA